MSQCWWAGDWNGGGIGARGGGVVVLEVAVDGWDVESGSPCDMWPGKAARSGLNSLARALRYDEERRMAVRLLAVEGSAIHQFPSEKAIRRASIRA